MSAHYVYIHTYIYVYVYKYKYIYIGDSMGGLADWSTRQQRHRLDWWSRKATYPIRDSLKETVVGWLVRLEKNEEEEQEEDGSDYNDWMHNYL